MEMGMQSPVISSMTGKRSASAFSKFLLKTGFVLFLTVDICAGFLFLLYSKGFRWAEVIPTALAVFSGLTAGILSRIFFKHTAKVLRWCIACLVIVLTLTLAGLVIQEWIHIDLTGIWYIRTKPDFAILTGMGWLTAFLAIFAWQKKNQPISNPVTPVANGNVSEFDSTPAAISVSRPMKSKKLTPSRKRSISIIPDTLRKHYFRKNPWRKWFKQSKANFSRSVLMFERDVLKPIGLFFKHIFETKPRAAQSPTRIASFADTHRAISPILSPTPLPRKRLGRKMQNPIRLVGREELRCPYCLQVVERKDPRGIVVCPICKSAHHKECWDITGSCQVPHNHAVL